MIDQLKWFSRRRVPVILQTEAAECSLACLAMVSGFHGGERNLRELRLGSSLSVRGVNLEQFAGIAQRIGLQGRPLRLEPSEIALLATPCVLHWDLNHFVVLVRVSRNRVTIHDPAFGRRILSHADLSRHFTGVALELSRTVEFKQTTPARSTISLRALTGPVSGLKTALTQVLLLSVTIQAFGLLAPLLMQGVVDHVLVGADRDLLALILCALCGVLLLQILATQLRTWSLLYLSTRMGLQWIGSVFGHLLRLPMQFFEKRHLGDISSRVGSVSAIQQTLTTSFVSGLLDGVVALASVALMLHYSTQLAGLTVMAVLAYLALRLLSYPLFRRANEERLIRAAKEDTYFLESIRGIQSLKLADKECARHAAWQSLVVSTANQDVRIAKIGIVFEASNQLIFGVERILVVGLGALMVLESQFSIGMLIAYLAYKEQFSGRLASLIDTAMEFRMLRLHGERLADIVLTLPETAGRSIVAECALEHNGLVAKGLSFRYSDSDPWILKDCDFSIAPGEAVAIVGPSGCGKSTMAKLMLGLLQPTAGTISVGGSDISRIDPSLYRSFVAAVMQEDQLFGGSIADNIAFGEAGYDLRKVEEAAKLAAVHDEIVSMPMGYQSLVGDMGTTLSGGQKQRVVLARALYRKPRILFLDEATSHLDAPREQLVNDAISGLALTKVIVAHRPETIASADRVLVVKEGRVECAESMRNSAGVVHP